MDYCKNKAIDKTCDEFKGLYTSICPPNYKKILRFICAPICPDGYSDNGSFCYKPNFKSNPNSVTLNFYDLFM